MTDRPTVAEQLLELRAALLDLAAHLIGRLPGRGAARRSYWLQVRAAQERTHAAHLAADRHGYTRTRSPSYRFTPDVDTDGRDYWPTPVRLRIRCDHGAAPDECPDAWDDHQTATGHRLADCNRHGCIPWCEQG